MTSTRVSGSIKPANFTLEELILSARAILSTKPDPVIARRLLREVVRVPESDLQLSAADGLAGQSRWVQQLEEAQLPDGSWGRFHSQDTRVKSAFRTTEEAIDRANSLGIPMDSPLLARTRQYILDVLAGKIHITDRTERAESWPLLIKLILAGRLAQVAPNAPELDYFAAYLEEVAEKAFKSGNYQLQDEADAHVELSGIHVPGGFLESQHALWILSSRRLPSSLEISLVDWIWHKKDGIRYLRAAVSDIIPRQIGYWIRSQNILARLPSWRKIAQETFNLLWDQRSEDGMWDFGTNITAIRDFPISQDWRTQIKRKQDYSTCLLVLYRKFFD